MEVRPVDPAQEAVARLIRAHMDHSDAHYPAESNHHLRAEDYAGSGVDLFGVWDGDALLGIAGLKPVGPDHGEVKSMHVTDAARGRGVGGLLLGTLIDEARARGYRRISLETGSLEASAAARRLYARHGFRDCAPFPPYAADPMSVFMTLGLD
jgi:putative acetyltransferase